MREGVRLAPMRRAGVAAVVLAAALAAPRTAQAYEFWLRTRTTGQAYRLRDYQLVGPDLFLGRRRYTQTIALRITDVGNLAARRRRAHLANHGLAISFQSYLRVDHDFGQYATRRIRLTPAVRRDALDVIPELSESIANLDLLYGYFEVTGAGSDQVSIQVGRVLVDHGWGTLGVDGAAARVELPAPLAVVADAGLRVRASSVMGLSAYELDGTSGAGCREYVAGATPGTGTYLLVDRDRVVANRRLSSDYETCPQREVLQPTIGVGLETSRLRRVGAELAYRRTWSHSAAVYPDEFGQLPSTGVNEEHLSARAHVRLGSSAQGGITAEPYANARYSLLHGLVDRADAGVRLARGHHVLEPSVEYFYPTFDGDSIFNVFSIDPTADARLAYRYDGTVRATASAWLRRYHPLQGADDHAGGGDASLERALGPRLRARVGGLIDAGYGGRRIGGSAEAGFRQRRNLWLRGRALVLAIAPDDGVTARYVSASGVASTTWQVADGVALHGIAELDRDPRDGVQTRAIVILDFTFVPEP